jgi:hypothetical protein
MCADNYAKAVQQVGLVQPAGALGCVVCCLQGQGLFASFMACVRVSDTAGGWRSLLGVLRCLAYSTGKCAEDKHVDSALSRLSPRIQQVWRPRVDCETVSWLQVFGRFVVCKDRPTMEQPKLLRADCNPVTQPVSA